MPDTAPFLITDWQFKDMIEGNRYSSAWRFAEDLGTEADSAFLVQARNPDSDYVIVGPVKISVAKEYTTVIMYIDPTVSDTGTTQDSYNRRNDGPSPDSTINTAPRFSGGTRASDFPKEFSDAAPAITIPPMVVEHNTDIIFDLVKRIKKDGTIEQDKKPYGAKVQWSEVEDTIIPKIN